MFAVTEKWLQVTQCHTDVDSAWTSLANLTVSDRLQCAWACYTNSTCDHVSFYEDTCMLWQGEATCDSSSGVPWTVYKVGHRCDEGWYRYNGFCHLPVAQPMNWTHSVAHCESVSHLVSIRSLEKHNFIVDLVLSLYPGLRFFALGTSDISVEGVWKWVSGEPWDFENWEPGQPTSDGQDCLDILLATRKWHDYIFGEKLYFVGEK